MTRFDRLLAWISSDEGPAVADTDPDTVVSLSGSKLVRMDNGGIWLDEVNGGKEISFSYAQRVLTE